MSPGVLRCKRCGRGLTMLRGRAEVPGRWVCVCCDFSALDGRRCPHSAVASEGLSAVQSEEDDTPWVP